MTPTPTGKLHGTPDRPELHLTRTFRAPLADVWASITESERTARWLASWSGAAAPGATVRMRLEHEEGRPESDLTILACEPPRRLEVLTADEFGRWHLEARLSEDDGVTTLVLVHHLEPGSEDPSVGAGWEYYLDLLVASREGTARPEFGDYWPAMREYYTSLSL